MPRAQDQTTLEVGEKMAITDELIETLGGGGAVGLAVAAAVLAPAVYPPARRGLRDLAKAAIVQYLRVTESHATEAPPSGEAAVVTGAPPAAPPRRRGRPPRAASTPGPETKAPEVRALGAEPIAAPEAPARAPRARRARAIAPATEATPAVRQFSTASPQATLETAPPSPATATLPSSRREHTEPAATTDTPAEAPAARRGRPRANAEGIAPDGRINLNAATRAQLTRLPRIGAQTADRIIELREREGPIRNIRQLRQADIITVAAAKQMRDLVRF
jgi:hypothetical protein